MPSSREGNVSLWEMTSHTLPRVDSREEGEGGGQSVNGNSEISNLFLHPGSNPHFFFFKRSAAKKINLPGAELRVEEVEIRQEHEEFCIVSQLVHCSRIHTDQ